MRSSLLFVFLCLAAAPAAGHPLDMSRLDVQVEQERVQQRLTIREDSVAPLLGPDWSRLPPDELRTAVSATLGASNLSAGGKPCEVLPLKLEPGDASAPANARPGVSPTRPGAWPPPSSPPSPPWTESLRPWKRGTIASRSPAVARRGSPRWSV